MRLPYWLRFGYPWWYLFLALLFVIAAVGGVILFVSFATGTFHAGETGKVQGRHLVGKDGCFLRDADCVQQFAIEVKQGNEIVQLIFNSEDQAPSVREGDSVIFTGPNWKDTHHVLVWYAQHYTPNEEMKPVWTPQPPAIPNYSG